MAAKSAAAKQVEHAEKSTSRTVVVACKIPNGLVLQLQRPSERFEDTRDGPKQRSYNVFHGPRYVVRGPGYPVGTLPKGFEKFRPRIAVEGGYALTHGIPREFWEKWCEQNKNSPFLTPESGNEHGMIFAYDSVEDATAAARENEDQLSGLEPISTDEDAQGKLIDRRLPKPISAAVAGIGEEKR